jgi:anti-sigma factor RsiW
MRAYPSGIPDRPGASIQKGVMTENHAHLTPADEADLVALADGNLPTARRLEVEARVARHPALADALTQQRCALSLLAGLTTPAPLELRARVAELRCRRRRLWARRWLPMGFVAAAAATAALLVLLAAGGPVAEDIMAVSLRPATAVAASGEQLDGLRFPAPAGWHTTGARSDSLDGRAMRTVFYERSGTRVAYTIVSGPPLDSASRRWLLTSGRSGFVWVRGGHTCVVSGSVDRAVLANAASWR